jgi:hypothetical protein
MQTRDAVERDECGAMRLFRIQREEQRPKQRIQHRARFWRAMRARDAMQVRAMIALHRNVFPVRSGRL